MGMVKEFKEFAMRGNVVDMAVGIIIGGAFGKIITSMVNDIIMPPIGKLMGDVNFGDKFINLSGGQYKSLADAKAAGAAVIAYGSFVNVVIDFLIVAFCIFIIIKAMNTMKHRLEHAPVAAEPTTCPVAPLTEHGWAHASPVEPDRPGCGSIVPAVGDARGAVAPWCWTRLNLGPPRFPLQKGPPHPATGRPSGVSRPSGPKHRWRLVSDKR